MSSSSQLMVPVVLWGNKAPTHRASCVHLTRDQKTLATGSHEGQIIIWDISETDNRIIPRTMFMGHTAKVTCLASAGGTPERPLLVSATEAGEMSLWDVYDGRVIEAVKMPFVHTNIQSYVMCGAGDRVRLFCNGYYTEILLLDAQSLSIIATLTSRISSDWIACMHVIHPAKRMDDVVVALSVSGHMKVWRISESDLQPPHNEAIFEGESKPIDCCNAIQLVCCAYSQRTVLIITPTVWHVLDAVDFTQLCVMNANGDDKWRGGNFLSFERVLVWTDTGVAHIYQLPPNAIPDDSEFHKGQQDAVQPTLVAYLKVSNDLYQSVLPAANFFLCNRGTLQKIFCRADCNGRVCLWIIDSAMEGGKIEANNIREYPPTVSMSLQQSWEEMRIPPSGILDSVDATSGHVPITSSIYLPMQGRLVCGREDGSIVIVSALDVIRDQLLKSRAFVRHEKDIPFLMLVGHRGRVTTLLYPHHVHHRYEVNHLCSGGLDYSICLWDLFAGTLLHRFCVQAGEITQLLVPPASCNPRVLHCICSVSTDHSVALLSLRDRKCLLLASCHLFPVRVINWRPLDDLLLVGCSDGSLYVWQCETAHLDRVVQGLAAEEVILACDQSTAGHDDGVASNAALHFFRGLKYRNMAAIRHGIHQLQHHGQSSQTHDASQRQARVNNQSLSIQGLRTHPTDRDSHVMLFDVDALIVQLLSEEYATLSPGTLETQGLTNNKEYERYNTLANSPDVSRKFTASGILSKVKDNVESAATKIQQKAESVGIKGASTADTKSLDSKSGGSDNASALSYSQINLTMETAQLLLSLLHAFGVDKSLDQLCEGTLGLLCPKRPFCYGLISKGGHMAFLLPTHIDKMYPLSKSVAARQAITNADSGKKRVTLIDEASADLQEEEERALQFAARGHWTLSTAMTTTHLLSIIALSNTLMGINNATFIPEQEKRRKLHRRLSRADSKSAQTNTGGGGATGGGSGAASDPNNTAVLTAFQQAVSEQQSHIKQGWSLLASLHCVMLPDLVASPNFKRPQLEMLARRWQDRCLEVREAAQALLLSELRRLGLKGRRAVVEEWAQYLPNYGDQSHPATTPTGENGGLRTPGSPCTHTSTRDITAAISTGGTAAPTANTTTMQRHDTASAAHHLSDDEDDDDEGGGEGGLHTSSTLTEVRRKQSTAIVLLGVIGAEYPHEFEQYGGASRTNGNTTATSVPGSAHTHNNTTSNHRKSVVTDAASVARHTSLSLSYLLLTPPSASLPAHTSLRRAAVDIIGKGFALWEIHLDVTRVLLALLELCCDADRMVPTMTYGLPLSPAADSCRTARHALSLIATARPPTFITTLAKEVHRYNSLAANAQSLNISLTQTTLSRARPEILRVIELLIEKMQTEVTDLLIEVMNIVLHCLDASQLKLRGLNEVFPAICRFNTVSYCSATRRVAVGSRTGHLALYELRTQKFQSLLVHSASITAVAFAPDGKYLATYSAGDNKLMFFQTASGLFGLGNTQTRCVRTCNTQPVPEALRSCPLTMARLVWPSSRVVILLFSDGTEHRFNLN